MPIHRLLFHTAAVGLLLLSSCNGAFSAANASTRAGTHTLRPDSTDPVLANNASGFVCAAGAITCVQVVSSASSTQASVPVTFGQPFKAGDLSGTDTLSAQDAHGNPLPVQLDEVSRREDGSVRLGVVSVQLNQLQAGEKRLVHLFKASTVGPASPTATAPPQAPRSWWAKASPST